MPDPSPLTAEDLSTGQRSIAMKPRPRMLAICCVAFAAWVGFLGYLYVTLPHPERPTKSGVQELRVPE